ncbi:AMP-binding protein [Pedobacter sp. NJ-S-72]
MSEFAVESSAEAITLDTTSLADYPLTAINVVVEASSPVYVIYTSGSTGKSKGVILTHRNLADYLAGLQDALPIAECLSFGLMSSIATDLGNTVLFTAFLNGGALHVFSKAAITDPYQLKAYLSEHPIDCIKIVPSHWKALAMPDFLLLPEKLLIFGGEALSAELINKIRDYGK